MARFLLTVTPLAGHLIPFAAVGKALRARGHEVAFYTLDQVAPLLEREGFRVFPFERVEAARIRDAVIAAEAKAPAGWGSPLTLMQILREWVAGTVPEQAADLRDLAGRWRPDALLTDPLIWAPFLIVGELEKIPTAYMSLSLGCMLSGPRAPWGPGFPPPRDWGSRLASRATRIFTDVIAAGVRRRANEARIAHGLPPMGGTILEQVGRLPLHLIPSLPELDYDRDDLPPSVHYVGPCAQDKPSDAAPPEWLARLPTDRPVVHVTEGTVHLQEPFVLRAAARGLGGRPMEVVLTTGPHRDPAALGPIAPNVRVEEFVSHSDLLPRCHAIVTTGGTGTILAALRAGLPMVLVPTGWDHPDNARRVEAAGAGIRLSPRRCTPEALRRAVERVLGEPEFGEAARRLGRRLEQTDGPRRAAELLEGLVIPAHVPSRTAC
jgi:UDP:flavonoid glycosyltransferase YjiC (YdhE family)